MFHFYKQPIEGKLSPNRYKVLRCNCGFEGDRDYRNLARLLPVRFMRIIIWGIYE